MPLSRTEHKARPTVRVLGVQLPLCCPPPRQEVIAAPIGHSIVPDAHDLVFCIHDASSDLQRDMRKGLVTPSGWSAPGEVGGQ